MNYLTAIFIVIVISVLAGGCVFIVRKYVHISFLQKHHEVAFTIFLQEGVIYGVLLAFVVSVVWAQFNEVGEEMQREVSDLLVVAQLSTVLPEPLSANMQSGMRNYMQSVLNQEWKTMYYGQASPQSRAWFDHLQAIFLQYKPQNFAEAAVYSEILRHLSEARESRRIRLFHSALSVPKVIWVILIGMGLMMVTLPLFFGMEHRWSQALITGSLAAMITSLLLLIILLDNPFGRNLQVDKKAFTEGLNQVNSMMLLNSR
jgi:Protein of unknown function (DUF4239)